MAELEGCRAVVLAGGQGKRMKSAKPKVLHDILGRTMLERVLDALDGLNLQHVHIVIGHGADTVAEFLQTHPPKVSWSTHLQEPQLGSGHALMQVVPALKDFAGTLLVVSGDTPLLTSATLLSLIKRHGDENATVTVLTTVVEDPRNYGRIIRNQKQQVLGIVEDKDATAEQKTIREVNSGIYCLEWPAVEGGVAGLKNNNKQGEYYITDLIHWACTKALFVRAVCTENWAEVSGINSRLELAEAARLLRDRVVRHLAENSGVTIVDPSSTWVGPEVMIGPDTTILPGCYLVGSIQIGSNCLIGPHVVTAGNVEIGNSTVVTQSRLTDCAIGNSCRIGPFAHLRDHARIGDNVRLGNFIEIKNSEIGERTSCSHLSYVGDATVGSGVNIGAGTITANYDHITKVKSRTTIGDGASTGSNSVLVAPVAVGESAVVAAGSVITKDVPAGALAVARTRQENKPGWAESRSRRLAARETS